MPKSVSRTPLLAAGIALVLAVIPMATLMTWPDMVLRMGIGERLWYITALLLGLGVALSLYALFASSIAQYRGTAMGGTLELGGPPALVVVFLVLGFTLPPNPSSKFDVTVLLRPVDGAETSLLTGARLRVDLDTDPRVEEVDAKGVARFVGIPSELTGRKVPVKLTAPQHELVGGVDSKVLLSQAAVYLDVRWKTWRLEGQVQDDTGRPVADATVAVSDQKTVTDAAGRFSMTLNMQMPESKRVLEVQRSGYTPWRNVIGLGAESASVQLLRAAP